MVTSYSGFEDFADAVQAQTVKTTGEGWQALSDECKAGSEGLGKEKFFFLGGMRVQQQVMQFGWYFHWIHGGIFKKMLLNKDVPFQFHQDWLD